MARPKKSLNELWVPWNGAQLGAKPGGRTGKSGTKDTGSVTRHYSDAFVASVNCKKHGGDVRGEVRIVFTLPVSTVPHGKALCDKMHSLLSTKGEELIVLTTPDAVRRRREIVTKEILGARVPPAPEERRKRA